MLLLTAPGDLASSLGPTWTRPEDAGQIADSPHAVMSKENRAWQSTAWYG